MPLCFFCQEPVRNGRVGFLTLFCLLTGQLAILFLFIPAALLFDDLFIAWEILMNQSLLPPAVKGNKGPAAAGAVYRITFRKSCICAFEVAKFHCTLYCKIKLAGVLPFFTFKKFDKLLLLYA